MDATATNQTHKLRADTLAQIAADVHMHGLPSPKSVDFCDSEGGYSHPHIEFRMDNNQPITVDAWAEYLNLGAPVAHDVSGRRPFVSHGTDNDAYYAGVVWDAPDGWREMGWEYVRVWCSVREVTS